MISNSRSGNVLFYILIGVALLAALSYTVATSSRGGTSSISADKARLFATEIIEYGGVLANAVSQLRLRGYKDTEISFENGIISGYTNANCTEDGCKVFHPGGAGVSYMAPKMEWLVTSPSGAHSTAIHGTWFFDGNICVDNVGTGAGASCHSDADDTNEDLVAILGPLDQNICLAINARLGIADVSGDAPADDGCAFDSGDKFTGSYADALGIYHTGSSFSNIQAGCFKGDACAANAGYFFYKVLIPR